MKRTSAQIMLEYLVMTVLIAFLIFSALNFKKDGSIGKTTVEQAQQYYKRGYDIISTGKGGAINGGWCEPTDLGERSCACPRPALGGKPCS
jgi:hypothetical protein